MECLSVNSFEGIVEHLSANHDLMLLRQFRASNYLYEFGERETRRRICLLKKVSEDSQEVRTYRVHLPIINAEFKFERLHLPRLLNCFHLSPDVYLFLPYYEGKHFDFNTDDIKLAKDMVDIVEELMAIDVERVLEGGSNFNSQGYENDFWNAFQNARKIGLIGEHEEVSVREQAALIFAEARSSQRMIISNGDFNPRNIIRTDEVLVVIDWNGIVFPLEHHLTYPWLLNWQNDAWRNTYATEFEGRLPVVRENLRMNLMYISLKRAIAEKRHRNNSGERMATNHMKDFRSSVDKDFSSLTEL